MPVPVACEPEASISNALTNELESRVAEIQRQKEEKKGKQEDKERKRKETKKPKQGH